MGGTRTNPAYLKIPGLFIGARSEEIADETPAELSAQYNKLTAEEQAFLDSQAS